MSLIKCPNCGASIKNTNGACIYCGSNLNSELPKNNIGEVKPVVLAAAIENSLSNKNANFVAETAENMSRHISKFSFVSVVIFFAIWCGITLSFALQSFGHFGQFSVIAICMFGFGVVAFVMICVAFFKQFKQEKLMNNYLSLVKELKFDRAFELGKNEKTVIVGQALIAFYHKKDYDLAGELVLQTNYKQLKTVMVVSPLLENMYKYFGVELDKV